MVRKLKHHEQKLLKKVDFLQWKSDNNLREVEVMRRYHIQVGVLVPVRDRCMICAYLFRCQFKHVHVHLLPTEVQNREDYVKYNKLAGLCKTLIYNLGPVPTDAHTQPYAPTHTHI